MSARVVTGDASRSLPEFIFATVSAALADAGCTMADVDAVVIAAHDLVDGRSLSSMITGPAAGAYLRDEIRVSDDGLVAVSLAAARLQAHEATRVLVAAWGRASEGSPQRTSRAGFDPVVEQPLGLTDTAVSALRASAYLRRYPGDRRTEAAAARWRRAAAAPADADARVVAPLRPAELAVTADAAAAVVLGPHGRGPRVTGVGHGTDRAGIGDRDLVELPAVRDAVVAALRAAGRAVSDVGLAELAGPTLFDEVLTLEAAGLAARGEGLGVFADSGWVNPSGGSAAGDCFPCGGLLRFVAAARRLRGHHGDSVGLVVAGSTVAQQTATAVVLERI
ncbi:hypothetical protein [Dactylosporangium sp. NPDC048998]|uniref:thiolase C-terminal domain-containing protein n=1 Tax=Dactylosporangium sp. NPDC048998 TaxID=3363976 RepID=UPI003722FAD3